MRRIALAVVLALNLSPLPTVAQSTQPVYRIGVIYTLAAGDAEHLDKALSEGLRELGYLEGRHFALERRFAEGKIERLPALAAELTRLNVDVIVTGSNLVIAAVKRATTTIPIVMAVSRDPVGSGFIASLGRPGGNITGLANDPAPEIQTKNLELLREAVPRVSRVALLWNPTPSDARAYRNAVESAVRRLGGAFQAVEVRSPQEHDGAFGAVVRQHAQGLLVLQEPVLLSVRRQIVDLAARYRLPAVYSLREFVEVGGLMSYGVNIAHQFRRAATYVDKILKGPKPADLPVEQPTQFELVINLKTAKALGLTIPQSLLGRADEIIQ